jgi:hypothetical protein
VLGVPSGLGAVGAFCLALGVAAAALFWWRRGDRFPKDTLERAAAIALTLTAALGPYLVWRIVEDLRVTVAMSSYDRQVAGPVQAYLQPYLLDPVRDIIPPGATYAVATGARVRQQAARDGFAPLAMITLFPRRSVAEPGKADWVIAWGTPIRRVAPMSRVVVARPPQAGYPAVVVGRVR